MERIFSPCTRLFDLLESQGHRVPPEELRELNLDVSSDEFLSAERALTYADLYAMLGNEDTVAWLTSHAAVVRAHDTRGKLWGQLDDSRLSFRVDGKEIHALARFPEHLLDICDVVLRLLAASVVHSVILDSWYGALISSPSLAYLIEQCQSLKFLSLMDLEMDENHCRALGAYSRPGLEIVLISCKLTNAGTSALAEVLGRNQGPTELVRCVIDNIVIADGLRGNSRLKLFRALISSSPENDGNRQALAIAGALGENKGLIELNLGYGRRVNDETWGAICDSVKKHPTLEVFNFQPTFNDRTMTPAALTSRIQALVNMLKVNKSIHTIQLPDRYSQHELFRGSVIPYLETNRLRPRVLAIQKTRPITYRTKVLGRALLAVRTDVNSFWMLLSGNPEVAFPSTTATTTLATNLPTPATVGASANAAPVVATGSTTAASNVVVPAAGQKRKACP
jgi:hypothetical protein